MPPHPSYNFEKSPVDHWDYSGLQVDTRARENSEKHLDISKPQAYLDDDFDESGHYLNEKQSHTHLTTSEWGPASPDSAGGSTLGPGSISFGASPITPKPFIPPPTIHESHVGAPPPVPPERRILGLRRKPFWLLFGTILVLLVAAAIIGGVVGGMQARSGSSNSLPATTSQSSANSSKGPEIPIQGSDVMAGSPLSVVTYDQGPGQSYRGRQAFRVVYQSAIGDIKEAANYHYDPWLVSVPIFTDALNHTGLASATYLNMTSQQGSIFYVGSNGKLQEKRKIYNNTDPWIPGTLNNMNIEMAGNFSAEPEEAPQNGWDGYRLAAVYSPNFQDGPGIRLFYHTKDQGGKSHVQELIWNQENDQWSKGKSFSKPYAYSHLTVTVDETQKILRLFFSSGGKTLSEAWLDISDVSAGYKSGLDSPGLLHADNAYIGAASLFGATYVYYYSEASQTAKAGIHEMKILGVPGDESNKEGSTISPNIVVAPNLNTSAGDIAAYQPLAVSWTAVPGLAQQLFVFWADKPSGDPNDSVTGFDNLQDISRMTTDDSWSLSTQRTLALGHENVGPADADWPGTVYSN